jgi:hypothetical protein
LRKIIKGKGRKIKGDLKGNCLCEGSGKGRLTDSHCEASLREAYKIVIARLPVREAVAISILLKNVFIKKEIATPER